MNPIECMQRAIELAQLGLYSTSPNPRVGCVIVNYGRIVGEGWHVRAGHAHAEVHALRQAGAAAAGATAYVTLEPCCHFGATAPCADALISAGVKQVVIAMVDPNPQVAGQGVRRLRAAGISVAFGLLEQQARQLNRGFIKRMVTGLPLVRVKMGVSLDGRTAMHSGESQWITGPLARAETQRLRAQSSAVITGADTVLRDQARLTIRKAELQLEESQACLAMERPPLRVLIDSQRRVPPNAAFFTAGPTLVATTSTSLTDPGEGQELLMFDAVDGQVPLEALLKTLANRGANEVLIEAGSRLVAAFARLNLVDEYIFHIAAKFLGSTAKPALEWPIDKLGEAVRLEFTSVRPLGDDICVTARPAGSAVLHPDNKACHQD